MTQRPKIRVAIVDNSINPDIYTPVQHWTSFLNAEWRAFRAPDNRLPDFKEGFTHIILSGSEASILDRDGWVWEEVEFVQEALIRGLSILGSCYGHQLLALALRGPAHVRRSQEAEIGWIPIEINGKADLLGRKGTAYTFSSHFDEVVDLDDSFEILASTDVCPIQAFELKGRPVWGVQPHPEIDIPSARKFLESLVNLKFRSSPLFEKALESAPRDSGLIFPLLKKFLGSNS